MSDQERLRQQMAQIGVRYITRTLGEMPRMRELLEQALDGSPGLLKDLEHLAHKIHGSGAMFGFESLSDHAGEIEHLAGFLAKREGPHAERFSALNEEELHQRLRECVGKLDAVARTAAKAHGIEPGA